jgi:hypothetical protein
MLNGLTKCVKLQRRNNDIYWIQNGYITGYTWASDTFKMALKIKWLKQDNKIESHKLVYPMRVLSSRIWCSDCYLLHAGFSLGLFFDPERWRRYNSLKRRLTFHRLHDVASQMQNSSSPPLLRTSSPTLYLSKGCHDIWHLTAISTRARAMRHGEGKPGVSRQEVSTPSVRVRR